MDDNDNELIGFRDGFQMEGEKNEILLDNSKQNLSFCKKNRVYFLIFGGLLIIGLTIFLFMIFFGKKRRNKQ